MNQLLNNTLRDKFDELAAFESNGTPFVSLYLNVQPDQNGRDNLEPFVRKELTTRIKSFPEGSAERESIERDAETIASYLSKDLRPSANGVAIFACAGAENYFSAIQLDVPIPANSVHVSDGPHLYPLAHVIDMYPRYVAVLADTDVARLFVIDLGRTKLAKELDNTDSSITPDGVWSRLRYQRRLEKYNTLHAREVAEMLEQVVRDGEAERIVLAGDDVIIRMLHDQLPAYIAEKVIDILPLDIRTPEHEVLRATMEALQEDNIQTDAERVRDLLDKEAAGGLAVVGVDETVSALARGQVVELLVSTPLENIRPGQESGNRLMSKLKTYDMPTAAEGNGIPTPESIARVLISLAHSTNATITFIEDAALLSEVGGVGAFLRYREDSLSEIGEE